MSTLSALQCYLDRRPDARECYALLDLPDWHSLAPLAGALRDEGWGRHVT